MMNYGLSHDSPLTDYTDFTENDEFICISRSFTVLLLQGGKLRLTA